MESFQTFSAIAVWPFLLLNMLVTLVLLRSRHRASTVGHNTHFAKKIGVEVGEQAPHFEGETPQGTSIELKDYAGKVVVLVFIAHWCKPCRDHLPGLEEIASEAREHGIQVLYVCDSELGNAGDLSAELDLRTPLLVAPRESHPLFADYKVVATPTYCAIDPTGRVASTGAAMQLGPWLNNQMQGAA